MDMTGLKLILTLTKRGSELHEVGMNRNALLRNIVSKCSVEPPRYVTQQMGVIESLTPTVNYQEARLTDRG